jgi:hypothetical protein
VEFIPLSDEAGRGLKEIIRVSDLREAIGISGVDGGKGLFSSRQFLVVG